MESTYTTRPCTICHAPIVDLPDAPLFCPTHDPAPVTEELGNIVQVGEHEDYVAIDVRRVGLFAHIVSRYRKVKTPITVTQSVTTWIDKETGRRMGRLDERGLR